MKLSTPGLFVAVFLLVLGSACDIAPVIEGEELAGGRVRTFTHGASGVASYLIEFEEGRFASIDAGESVDDNSMAEWLQDEGHGTDALEKVFVTHGHGDHIGGIPAFGQAQVLALGDEASIIEGRVFPDRPFPRTSAEPEPTGITLDDGLVHGDRLLLGLSEIEVFAIPGHTRGSAAYLFEGVLFLGDAVTATSQGTLTGATWVFSTDTEENLDSLRDLVDLLEGRSGEVLSIASGHTQTLHDGLNPLIDLVADRREDRF